MPTWPPTTPEPGRAAPEAAGALGGMRGIVKTEVDRALRPLIERIASMTGFQGASLSAELDTIKSELGSMEGAISGVTRDRKAIEQGIITVSQEAADVKTLAEEVKNQAKVTREHTTDKLHKVGLAVNATMKVADGIFSDISGTPLDDGAKPA